LVAKEAAKGDKEGLQNAVCQAIFVGSIIALIGGPLIIMNCDKVLSVVLKQGAPALVFAKPYLLIRACSFLFQMISVVGFSAYRGNAINWKGNSKRVPYLYYITHSQLSD
jgi:Na+-driven multidrug efflux pump